MAKNSWLLEALGHKFIIQTNKWEIDFDKIYLYAKDPYKAKYQFLINKRESTGWNDFNASQAFTEYPNDMDDIYKRTMI